jgi:hypothetical protein
MNDRRPAWGRSATATVAVAAVVVGFAVFLTLTAWHTAPATPQRPAASLGVQTGRAPWSPETRLLRSRLDALALPGQSDTAFHIHALLRVFVDGRPVPVPAGIGIDPGGRFIAPLHTHDAGGIVHLEADRPYPFTLGQFFTVWGVRLTDHQLGGYTDRGDRRLRVFVNGQPIAQPMSYIIRAHDKIVVGFGRPGSVPIVDGTPFPPGL